jgi:hypothetical protein
VLDRSPQLRARADALGLECLDDAYAGWNVKHRFVCPAGHVLQLEPRAVVDLRNVCVPCHEAAVMRRLHEAAAAAGTECLDQVWHGVSARYRFRCAHGHEWTSTVSREIALKEPYGCLSWNRPERRRRPQGLKTLQRIAAGRRGECLTHDYAGIDAPYRFRCKHGHVWEASGTDVIGGSWCDLCACEARGMSKCEIDGLRRLRQAAAARGGTCTSTRFDKLASLFAFRCVEGHEWESSGASIVNGTWCRRCAARAKHRAANGLERLRAIAEAHGGECLATAYGIGTDRYPMRCAKGHEWSPTAEGVLMGRWCQRCKHDAKRLDIETARAAARERGSECLSETYVNNETRLDWLCHRGHRWQAVYASVRKGTWCPQCARISVRFKDLADRGRRDLDSGSAPGHSSIR